MDGDRLAVRRDRRPLLLPRRAPTPASPFGLRRTSTPFIRKSTRSTSSCTIRAYSAGNSSSHSVERLLHLLLGLRRPPYDHDDLRLPEDGAELFDHGTSDLSRRHPAAGTPIRSTAHPG